MDPIDFGLQDKTALVTGAGQGVGEAIARQLAGLGVEVAVNDIDAGRADAVADGIVAAGGRARPLAFDVTDHGHVADAVRSIGAVDILVNNAGNAGAEGFGALRPFVETSPVDWAPYLAVNLYGVLHCTHAVLPPMIGAGWGRIITVVSDAGRVGEAQMAAYAAAKAGAAGFCRSIAREVGRHGITVNSVSLGTMRTPLTAPFYDDPERAEQVRSLLSSYLVRRPGDPEDVAWVVAMLASPRASWVTGQTIPVNGGHSLAL